MGRWRGGLALGLVVMAVLALGGSASAATMVGSNCEAKAALPELTIISLKNSPANPLPSAIPSSGVITSWSFNLGIPIMSLGTYQEQLKVFAPVGPNQFKVVGESALGTIGFGSTNFPTRVPVQSGDLIGSHVIASNAMETAQGILYCATEDPGDEVAVVGGNPTVGTTSTAAETGKELQNPVTVAVEPDADGDGYGDETQDQCPTDASTQGACPVKTAPPAPAPSTPAPITLSGTASAKNGLVVISVTASAQANVTVGGSVKLGKGKTATLSGGTQIVAPGGLAKFTVLFPAKLKAALKQTPKGKKLSLALSASAPGATSTSLTVKVAGQRKAAPRHRRA
jgi:hypothetical protein